MHTQYTHAHDDCVKGKSRDNNCSRCCVQWHKEWYCIIVVSASQLRWHGPNFKNWWICLLRANNCYSDIEVFRIGHWFISRKYQKQWSTDNRRMLIIAGLSKKLYTQLYPSNNKNVNVSVHSCKLQLHTYYLPTNDYFYCSHLSIQWAMMED